MAGDEADRFQDLPAVALPIDPEEQRRLRRARAARRWIDPLVLAWFVAHVVPYLILFGFGNELLSSENRYRQVALSLLWASQLFALFSAGAAAVVTGRNWSVLSRGWIVGGLFPWAVFVGEVTWMYAMTLL